MTLSRSYYCSQHLSLQQQIPAASWLSCHTDAEEEQDLREKENKDFQFQLIPFSNFSVEFVFTFVEKPCVKRSSN